MKIIQPVQIWNNGQQIEVSLLNTYATNVTLNSSATFDYVLSSQTEDGKVGEVVASGRLTMLGEAYEQWEIDNYAWDWVAEQLNLTIVGDYIPPTTTTTTTTEAIITTSTTTTI